jgi:D-sedoheptulose 7-phosphate isomerase
MSDFFYCINRSILIKKKLIKLDYNINLIIDKFYNTIKKGNKIFICGNGGSASDAEHLSTEFLVRLRPKINRKAFPLINLGMNIPTITACANDYSFDKIFSRSLQAIGQQGDVLIVISTSGKSKNIIEVLKMADKLGIYKVGLLGSGGGKAKKFTDINLIVPSNVTARVQECHIFLGHYILEKVENLLLKRK